MTDNEDIEIAAMTKINEALKPLSDEEARGRVLQWVNLKFGAKHIVSAALPAQTVNQKTLSLLQPTSESFDGIAQLDGNGNFHLTIRDLKARTQNDAAIRLALITIYAYKKLKGEDISSRKVLVPILKHYRLYDGNTRVALSKYKGLLRQGETRDILLLDAFAQKEAEKFISDVLDNSIQGSWSPTSQKSGKKKDKVQDAET